MANRAPAADAGPDQEVREETEVLLDGSASSDPDGDPLTFAWAQIAGPEVILDDSRIAAPRFQAPAVEADTDLVFQLVVFDGLLTSAPDQVTIRVLEIPETPDGGEDTAGDEDAPGADTPGEDTAVSDAGSEETPLPDTPMPDSGVPDETPEDSGPSDLGTDRGTKADTAGTDYGVVPLDLGPGDAAGDERTGGKGGGCATSRVRAPSALGLLMGLVVLWMMRRRRARTPIPTGPDAEGPRVGGPHDGSRRR